MLVFAYVVKMLVGRPGMKNANVFIDVDLTLVGANGKSFRERIFITAP
jgi:hypothetical protein